MKILNVIGARPQFVKAAMISKAFKAYEAIQEIFIHTGQHYDENMSEVFFQQLGLPKPSYQLQLGGLQQGEMTGRMILELEKIFLKEQPDAILVYGDTNTTLAAAIAASKLSFPLAHVEAGLRSYNKKMPEEINRVICDYCASKLYAPDNSSKENLIKEGIGPATIEVVGDIMYDAFLWHYKMASELEIESSVLKGLDLNDYLLATIHRQASIANPHTLQQIFSGLASLHKRQRVYLPLHPATKKALERFALYERFKSQLHFLPPLSYLEMIKLQKGASLILTDSGGVQKEAYFLQVPSVVIREETEWRILVEKGYAKLCPPQAQAIISHAYDQLKAELSFQKDLYGKGNAAQLIAKSLWEYNAKRLVNS